MNCLSFFTGAGGLDLGISQAGFNIKLCVEIEELFCQTLRANRETNEVIILNENIMDITTERLDDELGLGENGERIIENIDLMIGGSPCQSFSTAGRRRSFEDERGAAMLRFITLIGEIQPKVFLLENVKGLLSAALEHVTLEERNRRREAGEPIQQERELHGSVLKLIMDRFNEIGYNITYKTINSANYGVPQKRERVIFIGVRRDLNRNFEFPRETHGNNNPDLEEWVTFETVYNELRNQNIEHHYEEYRPERLRFMQHIPVGGGNWRDLPENMQQEALGGAFTSTGGRVGFFRRIYLDRPAPTVLTSPTQKSTNLGHPIEDRPLSIEEYKLLQGFPLNYIVAGDIKQQYKQLGNAVPVEIGRVLGIKIHELLNME